MPTTPDLVTLSGSTRNPVRGAQYVGPADPDEQLAVTVYLRPGPHAPTAEALVAEAQKRPADRTYLTPEGLVTSFAADPADYPLVEAFAQAHHLAVSDMRPLSRSLRLTGRVADVGEAFGVELGRWTHKDRWTHTDHTYRGRSGDLRIPRQLDGIIEAVLGLDNRRVGRSYLRTSPAHADLGDASALQARPNTFLPPEVGALYDFPADTDGTGQTVAVLAFNGQLGATGLTAPGGYDPALLANYFTNVVKQPAPQVVDVVVHGPGNRPGDGSDPNDSSGEIYLDLCIVGSLAPGAKIAVYFTEFTEQGWVDAINHAATDTANDPSVISISYGNPEDTANSLWSDMALRQVDRAFQIAAAAGRTVTCAAGDDGSADEPGGVGVHADFPASTPWVLGCGGTRLDAAGGHITSEVVWNDLSTGHGATGGGISTKFAPPSWQSALTIPPGGKLTGRGVPDVAALADPETPFMVLQPGGRVVGVGGTSAAAPLWGALTARLNQALGARTGFLNPLLYEQFATGVLRDITNGNNGAYQAGPSWDPCTGIGIPGGGALLAALKGNHGGAATAGPTQPSATPA